MLIVPDDRAARHCARQLHPAIARKRLFLAFVRHKHGAALVIDKRAARNFHADFSLRARLQRRGKGPDLAKLAEYVAAIIRRFARQPFTAAQLNRRIPPACRQQTAHKIGFVKLARAIKGQRDFIGFQLGGCLNAPRFQPAAAKP